MTQWGTAPPKGDQTPDTLAHKTKQNKEPTLELEFCFKQKKNKSQKATKRITSLLCFFIIHCLTEINASFLVLAQKVCWVSYFVSAESDAVTKSFFNASQSEPIFKLVVLSCLVCPEVKCLWCSL